MICRGNLDNRFKLTVVFGVVFQLRTITYYTELYPLPRPYVTENWNSDPTVPFKKATGRSQL